MLRRWNQILSTLRQTNVAMIAENTKLKKPNNTLESEMRTHDDLIIASVNREDILKAEALTVKII